MGVAVLPSRELAAEGSGRFAAATLVDARRPKAFLAGHIPGAIRIGWETWCRAAPAHAGPILAQEGYWGLLADMTPEVWGQRLAVLGLRDDRPIVVYADGPRSRGREGRIAWMLLYLGARDVVLLDGGWSGWLAAGGAVETSQAMPSAGRMAVDPQPERRKTLEELRADYRRGTLPLFIDTRSPAEFAGEIQAYLPRRGHLPGACLLPFGDLFAADGSYVTATHYSENLPQRLREAGSMVAYCEVGVRASLFALLHEAYTGTVVPVYDGSLMEWGLQEDLPVEGSSGSS